MAKRKRSHAARRANRMKAAAAAAAALVDDDVIVIDPPSATVKRPPAKKAKIDKEAVALIPLPLPPPSSSVIVVEQEQKKVAEVEKETENAGSGAPSLGATEPVEGEATHQLDPPPPPSASSPEVVELQQKLLKMEDKFQRACRVAREEQLRAERAETLLDTKHGIVAEKKSAEESQTAQIEKLKKELALLSAQLLSRPPPTRSPGIFVPQENVTEVEKESQESLGTTMPPDDSEVQPTHQLDPPPPPVPSPEVVELQQKLLKMEDKFQRACRVAREEQLRAERAEGLLDTKRGIVKAAEESQAAQIEKLKKDLALVSAQLTASRAKEADPIEIRKLVQANEALQREAAQLRRVCQTGHANNQELQERIGFLTYQLEMAQGQANQDRERIDHLSHRLASYEYWTGQQTHYLQQNNTWHRR